MTTSIDNGNTRVRRWGITAREARHHAILLAALSWLVALIVTIAGSGMKYLTGQVKATDFVYFYTLGELAGHRRVEQMYDGQAFHAAQEHAVPESTRAIYPPVYPPQTALVFIPFSGLSFGAAAILWVAFTATLYALIVWWTWRRVSAPAVDATTVFAAAASFPPFWQLIMNGQATILILASLFLGWLALERRHHFVAGLALGLLAIKPQFALPFVAIVIVSRDWAMLAGAVISVMCQAAVVWATFGLDAFTAYAATIPTIVAHADLLEPKPFESHSLRALTRLLPPYIGAPLWVTIAGAILWYTARVWRTEAPLTVRFGVAMLAAVLVNPHLIVYDATILVLPLLFFGAWLADAGDSKDASTYVGLVYALFLSFLFPTAVLIRVQLSVIVMLWMFWIVARGALFARGREASYAG